MIHSRLPDTLCAWLDDRAEALDIGYTNADSVVPALGAAGLFAIGVPKSLNGIGGDIRDAITAIAQVAERSLTASFVLWGQRSFIEYVLQSPNDALRARWISSLLDGRTAGATGLSNAMKFLSGIESLQITAISKSDAKQSTWMLEGKLPWVTNLRPSSFVIAAAVALSGDTPAMIVALPSGRLGLQRSDDLKLLGLRGSNTAAIRIESVAIGELDIIHSDARKFLPSVRPAFLGMQCGMSIGLARASIAAARGFFGKGPHVLANVVQQTGTQLEQAVNELYAGLMDNVFVAQAAPLFRLRIRLAQLAQQAVELELQASGGRAYLLDGQLGFARRWREAAFIPIITPSLTQLLSELQKQSRSAAQAA